MCHYSVFVFLVLKVFQFEIVVKKIKLSSIIKNVKLKGKNDPKEGRLNDICYLHFLYDMQVAHLHFLSVR